MAQDRTIPVDEQFFRWLAVQISRMPQGSISLDIEHGKLTSIGCHGHRFIRTPEELGAPIA